MSKKKMSFEKREAQLMVEFLDKSQILQEWDLNIKKVKKIGNDYKVKTHRGEKLLKVGFQEDRIMFMHLALEHLARNGCLRGIPRLIPTKYGDYYVKSDLGIYYLTDWLEGKEGKAKDPEQMIDFVKLLAEIHLASGNFQPVPYWAARERWDDISDDLERKSQKIKDKLAQLPDELQAAWPTYEMMVHKAWNLLKISGYRSLVEEAKRDKTLCHRQFVPRNGVVYKGAAYMLHWEHCAYGVQVGDLIYFMEKIMPSFDWNSRMGEAVIRAYHEIKPLSQQEIMTLGAVLAFPTAFVKLAEKCLLGKMEEERIASKMEEVKEEEDRKNEFLHRFLEKYDLKGFCWGGKSGVLSNAWHVASPGDLKNYMESGSQDITAFLVPGFTVSAQGRLQEELDRDLLQMSKGYQVPLYPVVQTPKSGEEQQNMLQVLADPDLKQSLIDDIDRVLRENNFPGVNIKFEVLSEEEMTAFNKFIKHLSRAVHEKGKVLMISAAAAKGENLYYDYGYLGKYCDYLLVEITEEDASCPESPVSKAYIDAAITYAAAHLPREKIVALLPVQGEAAEAVLEKAFLARQSGIAGCAFWQLGLEDPAIWKREPRSSFFAEESSDEDDKD